MIYELAPVDGADVGALVGEVVGALVGPVVGSIAVGGCMAVGVGGTAVGAGVGADAQAAANTNNNVAPKSSMISFNVRITFSSGIRLYRNPFLRDHSSYLLIALR